MGTHPTLNPATLIRAAEGDVVLFCLPPNTTHRTHPLDKGCFGPLKSFWKEECHTFLAANRGKVISRFQFSEIFGRAWQKGMTAANIRAGFKTTGICPFNPNELISDKPVSPCPSLCQKSHLKYIPFYSPVSSRHRKIPLTPDAFPVAHESLIHETPQDCSMPDFPPDSFVDFPPHSLVESLHSFVESPHFTKEEHIKFQRRKEEGYDIPDERYELWLRHISRHS